MYSWGCCWAIWQFAQMLCAMKILHWQMLYYSLLVCSLASLLSCWIVHLSLGTRLRWKICLLLFLQLLQTMAIATLAACYNNPRVFTGVVKIRKGQAVALMMQSTNMEQLRSIMARFAAEVHVHVCMEWNLKCMFSGRTLLTYKCTALLSWSVRYITTVFIEGYYVAPLSLYCWFTLMWDWSGANGFDVDMDSDQQ